MVNKLALRSGRREGEEARVFALDRIFPPSASQTDVFAECAPLVSSLLDGYSGAILAYGQTGSGKVGVMCTAQASPVSLAHADAHDDGCRRRRRRDHWPRGDGAV